MATKKIKTIISFPGLKVQGFLSQAFNRFAISFQGSLSLLAIRKAQPGFAFIARNKLRGFGKAVIRTCASRRTLKLSNF